MSTRRRHTTADSDSDGHSSDEAEWIDESSLDHVAGGEVDDNSSGGVQLEKPLRTGSVWNMHTALVGNVANHGAVTACEGLTQQESSPSRLSETGDADVSSPCDVEAASSVACFFVTFVCCDSIS